MTQDKMHPIVWIYHQEDWPCTLLWIDLVNQWRKWTLLINMIQRKTIRKGEEPLMAWELSLKALSFWSQVISIYTNEFKRSIFCGYENSTLRRFSVSSVQFSCSVVSDSLRPHESQHARLPCPSPTPGVHSDSRPSSWWCHPAISSSVVPFSSCLQSLPASESFPMSQLFAWGGQSIGVSTLASFLPKNIQGWSPLE